MYNFYVIEIKRKFNRKEELSSMKVKKAFEIVTVGFYSYFSVQSNFFEARIARGLSQREVGELVGLSRSYYGELERLEAKTTVDLTKKIMKVLNIEVEEDKKVSKPKTKSKSAHTAPKTSVKTDVKSSKPRSKKQEAAVTASKSKSGKFKTKKSVTNPSSKKQASSSSKKRSSKSGSKDRRDLECSGLIRIRSPPC